MRIVYVIDHESGLLALYTNVDTSARLRQASKSFSTNPHLLARRPRLEVCAHRGPVPDRKTGKPFRSFPTRVDSDGTWKVQHKTSFSLSVALVADLAFVDEDVEGSITFTHRKQACTQTLITPTTTIEVCANLVTCDGEAVPDEPVAGVLNIVSKPTSLTPGALVLCDKPLPLKCSVKTLSSKVCVLERMRSDLKKEENRLANLALHATHVHSPACLERIATLKEAIAIDQTRVGLSGCNGKPSAASVGSAVAVHFADSEGNCSIRNVEAATVMQLYCPVLIDIAVCECHTCA